MNVRISQGDQAFPRDYRAVRNCCSIRDCSPRWKRRTQIATDRLRLSEIRRGNAANEDYQEKED